MKRKIVVISSVIALVVLAVVVWVCWFFSPGAHFFWKSANLNFEQVDCYIISGDQIVDRTTMTMKGYWSNVKAQLHHDYEFVIENYTDALPDTGSDLFAVTQCSDGWGALYRDFVDLDGNLLFSGDEEEKIVVIVDFIENKPVSRVYFGEQYDRDNVYAVCADSDEEAFRLYRLSLAKDK